MEYRRCACCAASLVCTARKNEVLFCRFGLNVAFPPLVQEEENATRFFSESWTNDLRKIECTCPLGTYSRRGIPLTGEFLYLHDPRSCIELLRLEGIHRAHVTSFTVYSCVGFVMHRVEAFLVLLFRGRFDDCCSCLRGCFPLSQSRWPEDICLCVVVR